MAHVLTLMITGFAVFLAALGILGGVYVKTRDANEALLRTEIEQFERRLRVRDNQIDALKKMIRAERSQLKTRGGT